MSNEFGSTKIPVKRARALLPSSREDALLSDRNIWSDMMYGPDILVASMSVPQPRGASRQLWQYHSRSDLHSKVACWGVLFDLLRTSALLQKHAEEGKVIFGVNFEMRDYATGRKKDLDLVIARPASPPGPTAGKTLGDLAVQWAIELDPAQRTSLSALPPVQEGTVTGSGVLIALEAKAAMTAHQKARPRLYDELNSSHLTIHGASGQALAVGLVMVNAASTFISPGRQGRGSLEVSRHRQPEAAAGVIDKVGEIPRRNAPAEHGFDGLGIVIVEAQNDGTPVRLVETPPAPQPGDIFFYDDMLTRVANEYDTKFNAI
jgi:hypothetical protein